MAEFLLPRPLKSEDEIEITGKLKENPKGKFCLHFITGTISSDYENIVCELEVNFDSKIFFLRYIENGVTVDYVDSVQNPSDLFPDLQFQFTIKVSKDGKHLGINMRESSIGSVYLRHSLPDITYLRFSEDKTEVEKFNFKYT